MPENPPEKPDRLEERGSALWDAVTTETNLDAAGLALLEDICRTADIIQRLCGALRSKRSEWIKLSEEVEETDDGKQLFIIVNPILGEIRQQRLALRQMLGHLKIGAVKGGQSAAAAFWSDMESQFTD